MSRHFLRLSRLMFEVWYLFQGGEKRTKGVTTPAGIVQAITMINWESDVFIIELNYHWYKWQIQSRFHYNWSTRMMYYWRFTVISCQFKQLRWLYTATLFIGHRDRKIWGRPIQNYGEFRITTQPLRVKLLKFFNQCMWLSASSQKNANNIMSPQWW